MGLQFLCLQYPTAGQILRKHDFWMVVYLDILQPMHVVTVVPVGLAAQNHQKMS